MAASTAWRKRLVQHKIFEVLRKNQDKFNLPRESKNILVIKDGDLFVWDTDDCCILTTNLKALARDKIDADSHSETSESESDAKTKHGYQTFVCSCPPNFDVENIIFNATGTYLALIGRKGVTVVDVPRRWGKYAQFEDGNSKVLCKTRCIGERLFLNASVQLLHAQWHPGSETDTNIALLTNDNCIRIFDLANPEFAVQTCPLGGAASDDSFVDSPSRLQIPVVLGDVAIAFDFGPPVELERKCSTTNAKTENAWPMYVLWGNGDVYLLVTILSTHGLCRQVLQGPLTMFPPAEDNYGTDASAIICLSSTPPVIAIATREGKLYHCVVLCGEKDPKTPSSSEVPWEANSAAWGVYRPLPASTLYVFENIELELSLTTISVETDEPIIDDYTCLVRLQKDPQFCDRYYCVHNAGLHAVVLPWIKSFQQFCNGHVFDDQQNVELEVGPDQQAIVEHLVCTKPLQSSVSSPVLGVTMTDDPLLGSTLLCLTSSIECILLPLLQHHRTPPLPLLSETPTARTPSPLKKLYREPFDQHIRSVLRRSCSNPFIRSGNDSEVTTTECFQLLSRVTQIFREEHMQKLDLARAEILKRIRLLRDIKMQQMNDLQQTQATKVKLVSDARGLAEKFEEANERQDALNDRDGVAGVDGRGDGRRRKEDQRNELQFARLESILRKLQSRLPYLSDAETNMKVELITIEDNIYHMKQTMEQLRQKKDYQEKRIATHQREHVVVGSGFDQAQRVQLRTMLKKEGSEISDLVKMVNELRQTLGS